MSDDNVTKLKLDTTADIPPERVLTAAVKADLESVIVIGREKETGDLYIASSEAYAPDLLWEIERAKRRVIEQIGEG